MSRLVMVLVAVLAVSGCAFEMPPAPSCTFEVSKTYVAPGSPIRCTRFWVSKGGEDSCLRRADDAGDICVCSLELIAHGGERVDYLVDWRAGPTQVSWEGVSCSQ